MEQVLFSELVKDLQVKDLHLFSKYLIEIWRDLARRSQENSKGIEKITFSHYYELPGIINDRLFNLFDRSHNKHIDPKEFVEGMTTLFTGDFKALSKYIFNFYDFNKDGYITREDVRVVLSYVPLQKKYIKELMKYEQNDYKDRVESQKELDEMLDTAFGTKEKLNEQEFVNVIENVSSDIFIYILMYLLEKRPFTDETIAVFPKTKESSQTPNKLASHKIASPSLKSKFMSPMFKKRTVELGVSGSLGKYINKGTNKTVTTNKEESHHRFSTSSFHPTKLPNEINDDKKDIITPSSIKDQSSILTTNLNNNNTPANEKDSLSKLTKQPKRKNKVNLKDLEDVTTKNENFGVSAKQEENTVLDEDNFLDDSEEQVPLVMHEGYMYKVTESKKLKKVYFKLIGKDMYYFKNKTDTAHKGMHNLSGIFIKEESQTTIDGKTYYSFSVQYPKKTRSYFIENEQEYKTWMEKLHLAIDYKSLLDQFQIKEKAGKGKFGLVKIATHKKTGRKVAIKIMAKKTMNNQDLELAKTEIDILKVCQHPNIIKLYDVYEVADYIYIVMEYCSGGDLFSYIEKRGYRLPEPRVAELIHKLCMAIYYVHSYGIVHRDLKPENILMTSTDDKADIRLLDFGLSKIIGPTDKCTEPYGTLSYVAPEVLNEKPYGKEVDIWSIGIITYLLLCGFLPFDDETSEREIARQTIEDPVPYPSQVWSKLSKEAKHFVDNLLKKNPKDRLTIKQVLEHEWFKKFKKVPDERLSPPKNKTLFELFSSDEQSEEKPKEESIPKEESKSNDKEINTNKDKPNENTSKNEKNTTP